MGHRGQGVEAEELAGSDGFVPDHLHQVLDADPELPRLVVAGLVRLDVAGLERDRRRAVADRLRPLVHVEERAHPVPGPVRVVAPRLPQGGTGEGVEPRPGGAGREARGGDRDVPLEHPGVGVALHASVGRPPRSRVRVTSVVPSR